MRQRKRPRPNDPPPPWNPYDIMRMTAEEAIPLLWVPKVTRTLPSAPDQVSGYGVAVLLDEESGQWLTTRHTWLELFWYYERHAPNAECKVLLRGIDDSNYGAWLTARPHQEYVDTWHKLLAFLDDCGAREFGVNGEYLLDYCMERLGGYEKDYN